MMCINNVAYFVFMKLKPRIICLQVVQRQRYLGIVFSNGWIILLVLDITTAVATYHWWKITYISGKFLLLTPLYLFCFLSLLFLFWFILPITTLCMPWFFIYSFLIHSYNSYFIHVMVFHTHIMILT